MPRAFRFAISASAWAVLALFAVIPESWWTHLPVVCVYRNVFGFECLGCGMTRAFAALLHGRVGAALELNQLVPFAVAALALSPAFLLTRSAR